MIKNLYRFYYRAKFIPDYIRKALKNWLLLLDNYGQLKSIKMGASVNAKGEPMPWITYPAFEYLDQFDFSNKTLFEFGSGNSTLYWAKKFNKVYPVEHDKVWYKKIKKLLPENVTYILEIEKNFYIDSIKKITDQFDVIVIDGMYRMDCAEIILSKLKSDGFIILDNSDREFLASKFLRDNDLIQIDFAGFGPINDYTSVTSLFLKRDVKLIPLNELQPRHSLGGVIGY